MALPGDVPADDQCAWSRAGVGNCAAAAHCDRGMVCGGHKCSVLSPGLLLKLAPTFIPHPAGICLGKGFPTSSEDGPCYVFPSSLPLRSHFWDFLAPGGTPAEISTQGFAPGT